MGKLGRMTWKMPPLGQIPTPLGGSWNSATSANTRLAEVHEFGPNPGNLRMLKYVPEGLGNAAPLVVILHGCKQTAEGYDRGTGWSELAEAFGFALLFPEQKPMNNPNNCFTWFDGADTRRNEGEAASIKSMVDRMALDHGVDEDRVFITGLSAGGAMTAVMLATYPEVFAAGAIIAGLSYGAAGSVQQAFSSMANGTQRDAEQLGNHVRLASPHKGPWPRVSIWHGSADRTVVPANAEESLKQWMDVHDTMLTPERRDGVGYAKAIWRNEDGREVVESITIHGLAHGTPLSATGGDESCGEAGPFLLEAGVSSTHHIARFFGLLGPVGEPLSPQARVDVEPEEVTLYRNTPLQKADAMGTADRAGKQAPTGIEDIIWRALRSAGLSK